jgi:hypothetical protein
MPDSLDVISNKLFREVTKKQEVEEKEREIGKWGVE